MDETVRRVLDPAEDPSSAVDLWGKSRVRKLSSVPVMREFLFLLVSSSDPQINRKYFAGASIGCGTHFL